MLSVANVEFAIRVLVDGGGVHRPAARPARPVAVLPPALPRRRADLHDLVQRRRRHPGQLRRVHRDGAAEPARGAADDPLRGAPDLGEAAGRDRDPALRRHLAQAEVAAFWLGVADRIGSRLVENGGRHTAGTRVLYALGWVFFYRALKDRLGLRKVRYAASGAAPIAPEVLRFFMGIGVPMHEVYGMTENTAVATGNRPGRVKLGTVGEVHPGHRAPDRPGHRGDPQPAPRRVRRLLAQGRGHRAGR